MEYFIIENGEQAGPFTLEQLRSRHIKSDTLVWSEQLDDWAPAWKVEEIRPILDEKFAAEAEEAKEEVTTNVPPIPPHVRRQYEQQQNAGQQPRGWESAPQRAPQHSNKALYIAIAVIVVLLALLFATNPDKDDHTEAIKTEINDAIEKAMGTDESDDILSMGLNALAKMISGPLVNTAVDNLLEYHSYGIFSKTTITLKGEEQTASYGFFGKVWTVDSDDIVKALENENLLNNDNSDNNDNADGESSGNSDDQQVNNNAKGNIDKKLNAAADRIADRVGAKVEEKVNEKINEMTDSSNVESFIDKILSLF